MLVNIISSHIFLVPHTYTYSLHVRLAFGPQSYSPAAAALIAAAKAPGQDAGSYINAAKRVAPGPQASMHACMHVPHPPLSWTVVLLSYCAHHTGGPNIRAAKPTAFALQTIAWPATWPMREACVPSSGL